MRAIGILNALDAYNEWEAFGRPEKIVTYGARGATVTLTYRRVGDVLTCDETRTEPAYVDKLEITVSFSPGPRV